MPPAEERPRRGLEAGELMRPPRWGALYGEGEPRRRRGEPRRVPRKQREIRRKENEKRAKCEILKNQGFTQRGADTSCVRGADTSCVRGCPKS